PESAGKVALLEDKQGQVVLRPRYVEAVAKRLVERHRAPRVMGRLRVAPALLVSEAEGTVDVRQASQVRERSADADRLLVGLYRLGVLVARPADVTEDGEEPRLGDDRHRVDRA